VGYVVVDDDDDVLEVVFSVDYLVFEFGLEFLLLW